MFLIYINDLDEGIKSLILKFADDTKIFRKIVSDEDWRQLQNDLDLLLQWAAEDWQMTFNIKKCKVMHIGNRNLPSACYYMNGYKLAECQEEKDLGVLVSNNLKVGPQCNQAFQKANLMLGLLKRMIDNKTLHIMLSLYKSLVRPHVEYCVSAWSPHYIKDKDTSERIQHRFTRLIPGMQKLSYMERLAKLRLVIGQDRRSSAKKQNITSARSAI